MSSIDIAIVCVLVTSCVVATTRGFCQSAIDFLMLYAAFRLASYCLPIGEASLIHSSAQMTTSQIWTISCLVFGAAGLLISRYAVDYVMFDAGAFDKLFAFCTGIAIAFVVSHAITRGFVSVAVSSDDTYPGFSNDAFAQEALYSTTYHEVLTELTGATAGHPDETVVAGPTSSH